ncbi:MAG: N-acetylglucosamine-6-phosphate deacetylase [Defluviitaleaceae bacterium]|nr:N-acetylglucosamine-6-phosphate deacetylase [Defluviitaleaceae bacterium]
MIIANGILFCDDGVFRKTDIEIESGIIKAIGKGASGVQEVIDAKGKYIIPGLVDIHIHGCAGADFCDASPESIATMARFLVSRGTTSFLGTSLTLPQATLIDIFSTAKSMMDKHAPDAAILRGINMEGPFFNPEKRGAQNKDYIADPNFDKFSELNKVSGGNIKTVAIAPEMPNGLDFIKKARGITNISLAHSAASYDIAKAAFDAGACHVTHIFNGMSPFGHRDPGIVGAAADSNATVELICDGHHVHPSAVRAVFAMFGNDKVCLISDAMTACGMPDGRYILGGQNVIVAKGAAMLEGGNTLAGSVATLFDCLKNVVKFGISLDVAVKAATINPAKAMGIDKHVGSLTKGKQADVLILNKDLSLEKVIIKGDTVSKSFN